MQSQQSLNLSIIISIIIIISSSSMSLTRASRAGWLLQTWANRHNLALNFAPVAAHLRIGNSPRMTGRHHGGNYRSYSSPRDSEQGVWKSMSAKVFEAPVGELSTSEWHEAISALRYWRHQGGVAADDMRWNLLDRLVQEEQHQRSSQLPGKEFASVILAWIEHQTSSHSALTIMNKLLGYQSLNPQLDIDIRSYTMVLDAAIHSGEGGAVAAMIMNRVQDISHWSSCSRPDTVFFTGVISAYATSGLPDAPQRAESVLESMLTLQTRGADTAPNDQTYVCIMSAWANSGDVRAPEIVETYLRHIVKPDATAYSVVMNAWAKSTDPNACERCYSILKHMAQQFEKGQSDVEPNLYIYGCVVQAFGRRGRAREAEAVLLQLLDRYEQTKNPDLCPSNIIFNTLIDAWAKSPDRDGPKRAEALLEKMHRLADSTGNESLKPDTVSFTCVLNAWSKDPNGAQRADAIFNRMKQLHQAGNKQVKPNCLTYSAVLNCWAKSDARGAAERAHEILQELIDIYKQTGEEEYAPNHYTYTCVMDAWARSDNKQAPERVEALLKEMENRSLVPESHQYATATITWARSGRPESVERSEALVRRMQMSADKLGRIDLAPNVHVFNALLDVYSRNKQAQKAQDMMDRMLAGYREGKAHWKPDGVTVNTVISAWNNSGDDRAGWKAENCFQQMEKHSAELGFKPGARAFSALISAFARSRDPKAVFRAQYYMDEMKRRFEAGDAMCKPNVVSYSALLSAWSNCREQDALTRGYEILDEMKRLESKGDHSVSPNSFTYLPIVKMIAHSVVPHKAQTARTLLKEMDDRNVNTSIVILNKILWACVKSSREEAEEAFTVATEVFRRIHREEIRPSYHTYAFYFKLLTPDHVDEMEEALRLCRKNGFHTHDKVAAAIETMLRKNRPAAAPQVEA
jgi:hypothetical protein